MTEALDLREAAIGAEADLAQFWLLQFLASPAARPVFEKGFSVLQ
jgi:hypothetical protein